MNKAYYFFDVLSTTGADNCQWQVMDMVSRCGYEFLTDEALKKIFGEGDVLDGSILPKQYMVVWEKTDLYEYLHDHTYLLPSCAYRQKDGTVVFLYDIG